MTEASVVAADPIALTEGLLSVIERMSRDPSVDIDKVERLIQLHERMMSREAHIAYHRAMAEMQPKLPVISERGKILNKQKEVQSTYALWEDINEILKPVLSEHGFDLTFKGRKDGADYITVGILTHSMGHSEETEVPLPRDDSGNKNMVQAIGSAKSYGKRYAAFDLLNITTKGLDDDGDSASRFLASGEPKPRAVLDGPHPAKTALKEAVNAMVAAVRVAQSSKEIDTILRDGKATRQQAERDWPALINGDPRFQGDGEDGSLRAAVEARRALVGDDSMVAGMIRSMKECDTVTTFTNWLIANEDAIEKLDGAEGRTFELARDLHESAIQAMDTVTGGA